MFFQDVRGREGCPWSGHGFGRHRRSGLGPLPPEGIPWPEGVDDEHGNMGLLFLRLFFC